MSDIDDCADQPCQNEGNCTDAVNDYTCNCVAGYSGKNCSIGKDAVHVNENNCLKLSLIVMFGHCNCFTFTKRELDLIALPILAISEDLKNSETQDGRAKMVDIFLWS